MRALLALPLVAGLLVVPSACDASTSCTPSVMAAQPATKVDLSAPAGSAVLHAQLSAAKGEKAIAGATVTITLRAGGGDVYSTNTSTNDGGVIAYDLKGRLDPQQTVGLARATSFEVSFSGNDTYCSSEDSARFSLLG